MNELLIKLGHVSVETKGVGSKKYERTQDADDCVVDTTPPINAPYDDLLECQTA